MPSHTQVFDTVRNCVAKITKANGYSTDLFVENLRSGASAVEDMRQPAERGAMCLVLFHGNAYQWLPGKVCVVEAVFSVTVTITANRDDPTYDLEAAVNNVINDMETMFSLNMQAGNTDQITLENTATDSGYANPEAVAVFEVQVKYRKS